MGGQGGLLAHKESVASSRAFKESGGRLVALSFPETRAQRLGDTVVFYGSYEVTIATGTTEQQVRGRLTEVFVKRKGGYIRGGIWMRSREA